MRFGSLFSGIEAASVAWKPLGWRCAWTAEIDPFASALLAYRYPDVPNLGDVNEINASAVEPVDLIAFGSPCQSFSVAGKRLGLDDPRGNMALVGLRVVGRVRPRWVVWENVPGVLSSDGGRDFGTFLGLLGELGYGFAYRVLDAQHFGVPQRRRRVFVVGYLGDWRPAAAVLFEPESLRGDTPPRREAGQTTARPVGSCLEGGSGYRNDADTADNLIAADVAPPCTSNPYGDHESREGLLIAFSAKDHGGDAGDIAPTLRAGQFDKSHANAGVMPAICHALDSYSAGRATEDGTGRGVPLVSHSLRADGFDASEDGTGRGTPLTVALRGRDGGGTAELGDDVALAVRASQGGGDKPHALQGMSVRRLTPRECERLQGFPDDYTLIPYRGKLAADGPRYRALGNSFAVPVVHWIGHRIQLFEAATASPAREAAA